MTTTDQPAPRARTRSMVFIGIGALAVFLILLAIGVIPRVRNNRQLVVAADKVRNTPPQVYVIRPEPAAAAGLKQLVVILRCALLRASKDGPRAPSKSSFEAR